MSMRANSDFTCDSLVVSKGYAVVRSKTCDRALEDRGGGELSARAKANADVMAQLMMPNSPSGLRNHE